MSQRSTSTHLKIELPAAEYRVFVEAARLLRLIMQGQAPSLQALIQSKLIKHDATGVADDYLDLVGWPYAKRRPKQPRRSKRCARSISPTQQVGQTTKPLTNIRIAAPSALDLSRN